MLDIGAIVLSRKVRSEHAEAAVVVVDVGFIAGGGSGVWVLGCGRAGAMYDVAAAFFFAKLDYDASPTPS